MPRRRRVGEPARDDDDLRLAHRVPQVDIARCPCPQDAAVLALKDPQHRPRREAPSPCVVDAHLHALGRLDPPRVRSRHPAAAGRVADPQELPLHSRARRSDGGHRDVRRLWRHHRCRRRWRGGHRRGGHTTRRRARRDQGRQQAEPDPSPHRAPFTRRDGQSPAQRRQGPKDASSVRAGRCGAEASRAGDVLPGLLSPGYASPSSIRQVRLPPRRPRPARGAAGRPPRAPGQPDPGRPAGPGGAGR